MQDSLHRRLLMDEALVPSINNRSRETSHLVASCSAKMPFNARTLSAWLADGNCVSWSWVWTHASAHPAHPTQTLLLPLLLLLGLVQLETSDGHAGSVIPPHTCLPETLPSPPLHIPPPLSSKLAQRSYAISPFNTPRAQSSNSIGLPICILSNHHRAPTCACAPCSRSRDRSFLCPCPPICCPYTLIPPRCTVLGPHFVLRKGVVRGLFSDRFRSVSAVGHGTVSWGTGKWTTASAVAENEHAGVGCLSVIRKWKRSTYLIGPKQGVPCPARTPPTTTPPSHN